MAELAQSCPQLEVLDLCGCIQVCACIQWLLTIFHFWAAINPNNHMWFSCCCEPQEHICMHASGAALLLSCSLIGTISSFDTLIPLGC